MKTYPSLEETRRTFRARDGVRCSLKSLRLAFPLRHADCLSPDPASLREHAIGRFFERRGVVVVESDAFALAGELSGSDMGTPDWQRAMRAVVYGEIWEAGLEPALTDENPALPDSHQGTSLVIVMCNVADPFAVLEEAISEIDWIDHAVSTRRLETPEDDSPGTVF